MTTIAAPPRPPRTDDPEALFEEARRHRRQRRLKIAVAAAVVLATGAAAYALLGGGTTTPPSTTQVLENGVLKSVPNQMVILLVDVSGSTRATDIRPARLDGMVVAMKAFVDRLPNRFEVGVVSFSSTARVIQLPTRDRELVSKALGYLGPEAATAIGYGVAAGVRVAVDALAQKGIRRAPGHFLPAVIILASDGAQNRGTITPSQAAERARSAGIRVHGIALGTSDGVVDFPAGIGAAAPVRVPPDPQTVAQIARITGGTSFTAPTAARLEEVYSGLATSIAR